MIRGRRKTKNWYSLLLFAVLLLAVDVFVPSTSGGLDGNTGGLLEHPPNNAGYQMNFTSYHSYEELSDILADVSKKYSNIACLYSIGKTYEGRDVWALKISDNPAEHEPDETEVLYIGMHHAREWITHEIPLYFINYIVNNYGIDPWTTYIVNNRQLWIVPMLNPDGFVYDGNGDYNNRNNWRKNREPNWDGSFGTDLNRNYGWHWGELGYQGYFNPRREDYIGPYDTSDDDGDIRINEDPMDGLDNDGDCRIDEDPRGGFSTAETRIIRDLAADHDFRISMAYHSYAETIYWGWMYTRQLPPDEQLYKHIAEGINRYNGYEYRNYTEEDRNRKGPLVDGDLNDYLYGAHDILSFCIEVGSEATGGFYPPENMIIPLCELNLLQNLYVAEVAANPWEKRFKIEHIPLENTTEADGPYTVTVKVTSFSSLELQNEGLELAYSEDGILYEKIKMTSTGNPSEYAAEIPEQSAGSTIHYYISAISKEEFITTSPRYAPERAHQFTVTGGLGGANPILTKVHGFFMIGTSIVFVIAGIFAFLFLKDMTAKKLARTIRTTILGSLFLFIGGFPLGWAVAYQEFGSPWFGFPFGWDLVDNITLILFISWLAPLLYFRKNLRKYLASVASGINGASSGKSSMDKTQETEGQKYDYSRVRLYSTFVLVLAMITVLIMLALPHGS